MCMRCLGVSLTYSCLLQNKTTLKMSKLIPALISRICDSLLTQTSVLSISTTSLQLCPLVPPLTSLFLQPFPLLPSLPLSLIHTARTCIPHTDIQTTSTSTSVLLSLPTLPPLAPPPNSLDLSRKMACHCPNIWHGLWIVGIVNVP